MITEHLGLSPRIAWLIEGGRQCHIPVGTAMLAGSGISGVSSLVGGGKQASAAKDAAQIQADAARFSAELQQKRFEEVKGLLTPFVDYGRQAIPSVEWGTGTWPGADPADFTNALLTKLPGQWSPTMENLEKMPGYQFQLQQGMRAANNAGLATYGQSGNTIRAGVQAASGLAASNWQSNFNQWLAQQNLDQSGKAQTYNMLTGQVGTGLQAAGALGGVGIQSAAQVGNALQAAAGYQGAGIVGSANAMAGGLAGAGGAASNAAMMYALQQGGYFGNTGNSLGPMSSYAPNIQSAGLEAGIDNVFNQYGNL